MTHLGDTALHDHKVRVVDIELDGLKEGLNGLLRGFMSIEKIFGYIRKGNLVMSGMPFEITHGR